MKPKNILAAFLALLILFIASCTPSTSTNPQNTSTATPEPAPELWISSTIVDANSVFKVDLPGFGYIDREIPGSTVLANKDTRWSFSMLVDLAYGSAGPSTAGVLLVGQSLAKTEATLLLVHNGTSWVLGYRPDPAEEYNMMNGLETILGYQENFQITLTSGGRTLQVRHGAELVYENTFDDPLFRSDAAVTAYTENGPHSSASVTSLVIEQNDLSDLTAYALPEPTMTPMPTSASLVTTTPRWPPVFQDSGFISERTFSVSLAAMDVIRAIAFSPDGRTFTTAGDLLVIWDVPTGIKLTAKQESDVSSHRGVTYSPDGKLIAVGAGSNRGYACMVLFYDADSSAMLRRTTQVPRDGVISLAFSPDGTILASGMIESSIILWDAASGNSLRTLNGHTGEVYSLAFSPDGKILASGSGDGTIILWDTATWQPIRKLEDHTFDITIPVYSVLFLKDGQTLASSNLSDVVFLWDVNSGEQIARLTLNDIENHTIALSPDGKILAVLSSEGRLVLWDVANRAVLQTFETGEYAYGMAFSPDGLTLASSDRSNLYLWKAVP